MHRELLICAALFFAGCPQHQEEEPEQGARHVKCAPIIESNEVDRVELRGTIGPVPSRDAILTPQVAGKIAEVRVREGDRVELNQLIARIDAAPIADQSAEAEATLAKAKAERENAEAALARMQRVFEHGVAAKQEVDDAATKLATAKAGEAEAASIAARARRQLEWASVKSPLQGVVLKVMRRPGELVDGTGATPIAEVADISKLELAGDVTARELLELRTGAEAVITSPSLPDAEWSGNVSVVAPAVDPLTGLGVVRVAVGTERGPMPPVGVLGVAKIAAGDPRKVLLAPKAALRTAGGTETEVVVCGADKQAHVKKVTRGGAAGDRVAIEGEVAAGDRVAVEPVLGISDGDPLELEP